MVIIFLFVSLLPCRRRGGRRPGGESRGFGYSKDTIWLEANDIDDIGAICWGLNRFYEICHISDRAKDTARAGKQVIRKYIVSSWSSEKDKST